MKEPPVYEIKESKGGFVIKRPDGSIVNEHEHKTIGQAERHLDYLVTYGYAKRTDIGKP